MKIEFYHKVTGDIYDDPKQFIIDHEGNVYYDYGDCYAPHIGWRIIDQWQPIETAPKDGTVIFAIIKDYHYPIAIQFIENEWMSCWDEQIFNNVNIFSHWMPLPPNPKDKE